ncbi:MAG TPA: hypothetical protein VH044_03430 [Polyangiaceae bacterium]|jgi:hypothetical protein|nr:hypothetical protein [Polyangiaceae bacterium]
MATQAPSQSPPIPTSNLGAALVRPEGFESSRPQQGAWKSVAPWLGVGALTVAAALVFWLFDALPFQDLPAHAGLIAMRHRFANSPFEQHFFVLAPHLGPYSLFRSLGDVLVVPFGPLGAIRVIATLPLVVTPYVLLWARRRLHGDRSTTAAYFGLALGFGFMTLLGFASYLLGVAVFIIALTVWLELMVAADEVAPSPLPPASTLKHEIAIAVLAPCVFLAHGHAFVIFLGLAGVCALATGNRPRRVLRTRALVPALALAAWVAWRERASVVPSGSVPVPHAALAPHFQGAYDKLSLLITPTLITRTGIDAALGIFVWAVILLGVIATARSLREPAPPAISAVTRGDGASRSHSQALLVSLAVLAAAFLILPHSIGWFGFVDGRLVPLLLLLGLLAIRRQALGRVLGAAFDRGAPVVACGMVVIALAASMLFQAEASGWHEVLDTVPANARLLNLPIDPNSAVFTAHPFVHYDKLVLTTRPGVVSDVWFHQGSGIYPTVDNPALHLPDTYSESDLRVVDWPAYRLSDWDYVLIRTRPAAAEPRVPAELSLSIHRGGWWLYRHDPLASAAPRP